MGHPWRTHHLPSRAEGVITVNTHKHTLYRIREGLRAERRLMFPFRNMTVDHVVPQSKAGTDHT